MDKYLDCTFFTNSRKRSSNYSHSNSRGSNRALTTGTHGSLEGVGGLKTNEAYHSKADALVISEFFFLLKIYLRPFFGNVGFAKFGTFSALLALPVMIREGYGQIVYETLPHILLSSASLVTKSCFWNSTQKPVSRDRQPLTVYNLRNVFMRSSEEHDRI